MKVSAYSANTNSLALTRRRRAVLTSLDALQAASLKARLTQTLGPELAKRLTKIGILGGLFQLKPDLALAVIQEPKFQN